LARFYDLPADGSQLRHQFAQSGQVLSDTDLLRAAKHLGLKAGVLAANWNKLDGIPLPALAKRTDGRYYVVLAKLEGEKALIQDPVEAVRLERDFFHEGEVRDGVLGSMKKQGHSTYSRWPGLSLRATIERLPLYCGSIV